MISDYSVIIPMYNEAPSILLRTVHSFLSRTPPTLLADIIIVDDMSTNENMKQVLTDYVDKLPGSVVSESNPIHEKYSAATNLATIATCA